MTIQLIQTQPPQKLADLGQTRKTSTKRIIDLHFMYAGLYAGMSLSTNIRSKEATSNKCHASSNKKLLETRSY